MALLVLDFGFRMEDAWNATHREFCLLVDVKKNVRNFEKSSYHYDKNKVLELEEHLQNIGAI